MSKKEGKKLSRRELKKQKLQRRTLILTAIVAVLLLISLISPVLITHDPYATDPLHMKEAPSAVHFFGTDYLGRDVFSRVLLGARTSIFATLLLVVISFVIGTAIGIICGYYGGWVDNILMRITDILLSLPQLVLAIAIAGMMGGGLKNALIAIGITSWTSYARLARSHTMRIKQLPYIDSVRMTGCGDLHILLKHVFPNLIGSMLVNATLEIGTTMLSIAGLSFLGLGVVPPEAEWGSMVSEGRAYLQLAPWTVFAPALAIMISVMIFNYFGESVCDLANINEV